MVSTFCRGPLTPVKRFVSLPDSLEPMDLADTINVWECIGCGRIDHPQPCVGVCTDRKAEYVRAADYAAVFDRMETLEGLLRRIAFTTPRAGEFEAAWRALQRDARRAL
jgi:hypothetical protein